MEGSERSSGLMGGAEPVEQVWAHYRRTLLRIGVGARTLSVRLVPEERRPSRGPWPFDRPVVVVTAWNPGSVPREPRANALAQARLERELRAAGHALLAAEGVGEDSGWSEPSVAVPGLDLARAVALGVRYGQRALYRLDGSGAEVVGCLDEGLRERWPWRSRWEPAGFGSAGTGRTGGTPGPGGHRQT